MRNPHLRAKLAETLEALVPIQRSQNSSGLLSGSQVNMVCAGMSVYVLMSSGMDLKAGSQKKMPAIPKYFLANAINLGRIIHKCG